MNEVQATRSWRFSCAYSTRNHLISKALNRVRCFGNSFTGVTRQPLKRCHANDGGQPFYFALFTEYFFHLPNLLEHFSFDLLAASLVFHRWTVQRFARVLLNTAF